MNKQHLCLIILNLNSTEIFIETDDSHLFFAAADVFYKEDLNKYLF